MFDAPSLMLGLRIINPIVTWLVILVVLWIIMVGLFYLACAFTNSIAHPFGPVAGLTALAMFGSFWGSFALYYVVAAIIQAIKIENPVALGHTFLLIATMAQVFSLFLFVMIAGAIYNWGLKIDDGQALAFVQGGIPVGVFLLITGVNWIRFISFTASYESVADQRPRYSSPAPAPYRPPVSTRPAPYTPQPVPRSQPSPRSTVPDPARTADPAESSPNPNPQPYAPPQPRPAPANVPVSPVAPSPAETAGPTVDPRDPYATARTTPPRGFAVVSVANSGLASNAPGGTANPAGIPSEGIPGEGSSLPSGFNPVGDPSVGPGSNPAGNVPSLGSGQGTPVAGASIRPIPQSLVGKADWAMEYGQLDTALQHLYAAAVIEQDPTVLQQAAWSDTLQRPVFAVTWGVGVEGLLPANANLDAVTAGVLPALRAELEKRAAASAFGKHAATLVQSLNVGRTRDDLLGNARLAGVDVLAAIVLQTRLAPGTRRPETLMTIQFFDVLSGKPLWRSESLNPIRFVQAAQAGRNLGLELAAEAGKQANPIAAVSRNCPLDAAAVRKSIRELIDSRPSPPLAALFQVRYFQQVQKLTDGEVRIMVRDLVGQDVAEMLASGDDTERQELVKRWVPKLKDPVVNTPAPSPTAPGATPAPVFGPNLGSGIPSVPNDAANPVLPP